MLTYVNPELPVPDQRTCPNCGTALPSDVPVALCPNCLWLKAHESDSDPPTAISPARTAAAPASIGTLIRYFGDYELREEIARGGMGVVYKARQVSLNRTVALKMILAGRLADAEQVRRFHTEAEAAANLQHPGIVAIHEIGEHDGQHYFSMDYVEGRNLAQRLREGSLTVVQAATMLKGVAEAVHHAHEQGVLHRDLKPSNIIVDALERPHITDFGLAKRVGQEATLTLTDAVMGTPSYMAPEQALDTKRVTAAADLYSLGAILYECLTGQPPFKGETPVETIHKAFVEEPVPPSRHNSRVNRDLETICLKCLEKDPRRRYGTAKELTEELERFLNHEPILARPAGRIRSAWSWTLRHPWTVSTAAAVSILGLLFATYGVFEYSRVQKWTAMLFEAKAMGAEVAPDAGADAEKQTRAIALLTKAARMHMDAKLVDVGMQVLAAGGGGVRIIPYGHSPVSGTNLVQWDVSAKGNLLAAAFADGHIDVVQVNSGKTMLSLPGKRRRPMPLALSHDGHVLATRGEDAAASQIELWDLETRNPIPFPRLDGLPTALDFSPEGDTLAIGISDLPAEGDTLLIQLWEGRPSQLKTRIHMPGQGPATRRKLLDFLQRGTLRLPVGWATQGDPARNWIDSLCFHPGGKHLAVVRRTAYSAEFGLIGLDFAGEQTSPLTNLFQPLGLHGGIQFDSSGKYLAAQRFFRPKYVFINRVGKATNLTVIAGLGPIHGTSKGKPSRSAAVGMDRIKGEWDYARREKNVYASGPVAFAYRKSEAALFVPEDGHSWLWDLDAKKPVCAIPGRPLYGLSSGEYLMYDEANSNFLVVKPSLVTSQLRGLNLASHLTVQGVIRFGNNAELVFPAIGGALALGFLFPCVITFSRARRGEVVSARLLLLSLAGSGVAILVGCVMTVVVIRVFCWEGIYLPMWLGTAFLVSFVAPFAFLEAYKAFDHGPISKPAELWPKWPFYGFSLGLLINVVWSYGQDPVDTVIGVDLFLHLFLAHTTGLALACLGTISLCNRLVNAPIPQFQCYRLCFLMTLAFILALCVVRQFHPRGDFVVGDILAGTVMGLALAGAISANVRRAIRRYTGGN